MARAAIWASTGGEFGPLVVLEPCSACPACATVTEAPPAVEVRVDLVDLGYCAVALPGVLSLRLVLPLVD